MRYLDEYLIPFKGLINGEHNFKFEVAQEFFEVFNKESEITGQFHVKLNLIKETRMMVLSFDIDGYLNAECHLCLEPFKMEMNEQKKLVVKFGVEDSTENDEVITLSERNDELNIAQHIYDYINLAVPLRIVHPEKENGDSGCNLKAIKKLEEYKIKETESDDPRWKALKNVKFDQ